jgi:serine/threonine-protein kinase
VIEAAQDLDARRYTPGTLGGVAVRSDALGSLARVFDTLAAGVQAREDQLQARIDALQVELAAGLGGRLDDEITAAATAPVSAGFDPHAAGNGHEPALEHALFAGRFEIKSILGRGGMGVVYRARDRDLDEDVAIKVISPNLHWESNGAIERFKSEIRLARRISSPHIMRTHDLGEWNDTYFLTMEYVEGITLHQLIERRGKLLPTAVLGIAMQLTEALEAAHRQGVIHRDIKPANLLLDRTGVLKLMDFGVALMVQASATPTKAGLIIGTPAYMSPEQLLDDPVDARTDLYAAGVVLYECLTGRCPFSAEQLFQLVAKVLEDVPDPPATLDPTIPPALSQLVVRLMARHREDRPANAQELRGLLAALA